jgi:POT family proton-dependent oligopeptide transporter
VKNLALSHPASLKVFFATELWERYGFYVVQTLLALYLALHFNWPDNTIYSLVGSFTALTYILPVIGGWIADHLIGQKRSILLGTVCLFVSYVLLSCELSYPVFVIALSGVAIGSGLIKSNISSLLGNEYGDDANNRQRGFTIFYMGITVGIILGTTLPSYLATQLGWSAPFLSAALGILFAMGVFSLGVSRYTIHDYYPHTLTVTKALQAALILAAMWYSAYFILMHPYYANLAFGWVVLLSSAYLIHCLCTEPREQARKTAIIALLCLVSMIFWAFYFQMFLSFTLFIHRVVQPTWYGFNIPAPYYVTIESISMLCIGFVLHQDSQRAGDKFTVALLLMTLAFGLIWCILRTHLQTAEHLSPLLIAPIYILIALAELLLSPVGLCTITILSSRKKVSTMMGLFFVSLGGGAFLAGKLATITALSSVEKTSLFAMKTAYLHSFGCLFIILLASLLVTFVINQVIRRLASNNK